MLSHVGQLLPKISITDMYVNCIFLILTLQGLDICLCGLLVGNSLLILSNFLHNINSAIQAGCQLLLKIYITDLYEYCIFV